MTFEEAIGAFAEADALPVDEMAWVSAHWPETGARCRALVADYAAGVDVSERTERALFVVLHLLAERADAGVFLPFCSLLHDRERASLLVGEDGLAISAPAILISTFDGDPAPLLDLLLDDTVDDALRGELPMVLAYLARTRRIAESELYRMLAALPERLAGTASDHVWPGWVRAVGAMGFAGLSAPAEALFQAGLVPAEAMTPMDFWEDLRIAREDPGGLSSPGWDGVGPVGDARGFLASLEERDDALAPGPDPIRNPLRHVGRNDPCPCGSGRKYKKCCLAG